MKVFSATHSFPYLTKRIPVWSKLEITMDPLAVGIDEITAKTIRLLELVQRRQPNLVLLQGELQGAVRPTVNLGPLAIASEFMTETQVKKYGVDKLATLRDHFK